MPWKVQKRGARYVVVGEDGKVKGTHTTKEKAEKQRRALYANYKKIRSD
jgi:hypothetical protein